MEKDSNFDGGAYGSAGATGKFEPVTFIKKPQVIIRIISMVFSIIVFGCISSRGSEKGVCGFGPDGACGYGIGVGVTACIVLIIFLLLDAVFDNISNVLHRKYIVIGDILTSSVWTFLYFVCFCYLTDMWRQNYKADHWGKSDIETSIAFSFFSTGTFVALSVLAVLRYRQGVSEDLTNRPPDYGYSSDQFSEPGSQLP